MNTTVDKQELLATLTGNREKHKATFKEASGNYRTLVASKLRERAQEIEDGEDINLWFQLPEPEDHTEDYDEAITALEWDQRDSIPLTQGEFKQYVLDKWAWERSFMANTESYTRASL